MTDPNKEFLRKLLATFKVEAEEHLQQIVSSVVQLEQAGPDAQNNLVQRALKTLHTLKGASRAVNLAELEALCHALEDVFSAITRSGRKLTSREFDILHQAAAVAGMLVKEPTGRVRNQSGVITAQLNRLQTEISSEFSKKADPVPAAHVTEEGAVLPSGEDSGAIGDAAPGNSVPIKSDMIRVHGKSLDAIRYQVESLLSVELGLQHHISEMLELADQVASLREYQQGAESFIGKTAGKRTPDSKAALHADADRPAVPHHATPDLEIRCRRLAEELSKTRRNFAGMRNRLLDTVLETALVPFASALDQLPGMVRNLARNRGKQVVLNIKGESVQIDRRILDVVRDALMHLVTNAVDHGIESTGRRSELGKPAAGQIDINVQQRGSNQIAVTVADDGMGIDVAAVTDAAVKAGSIRPEQLVALSEPERLQLVLQAGISTSTVVTHVSGRGMGLAIVAEKVASVGGELLISTSKGAGCTFELLLPVRLATVRGLVLQVGTSCFVCPLSGIDAVRSLQNDDIKTVQGRETLVVGQRVVPALRLAQLLGISRAAADQKNHDRTALIIRNGANLFALLVDEIVSEQEVLPKSLGKQLRRVRYITGATQLGDGSLVPVLGWEDIAKYGMATESGAIAASSKQYPGSTMKRILVAEDSVTSRLLLKHILESAGYDVETAVDGLEALSKLRQADFDAVISDVEMPQMDGFALTESIRRNPKTEEMPVILVTSLQAPQEKERGLQAGADAYVVKGAFDQDNLLATIRRLI